MRSGNLRNKAELQSIGTTTNAFGEVEQGDYTKVTDVWCSITPISGKENFLSNADFAKTTHKIKIRYIADINASMRVVWGGRIFNFISVRNIGERRKELDIMAEEINNG